MLGEGELTKKLNVTAEKFSGAARSKIEAAGGSVTVVPAPSWSRTEEPKSKESKEPKEPKAKG